MLCPTCGNPVEVDESRCPHCGSPLSPGAPPRQGFVEVNLKRGQPTVEQARDRLDLAIKNHLLSGTEGLRLIHGYGSSGEGGQIKEMVHQRLEHLKYTGKIHDFVPGEALGMASKDRLPRSYTLRREDLNNLGITIVKL